MAMIVLSCACGSLYPQTVSIQNLVQNPSYERCQFNRKLIEYFTIVIKRMKNREVCKPSAMMIC